MAGRGALALFLTVCLLIACVQTAFAVEVVEGADAQEDPAGLEFQVASPEEEGVFPEENEVQEVLPEEFVPEGTDAAEILPEENEVQEVLPEETVSEEADAEAILLEVESDGGTEVLSEEGTGQEEEILSAEESARDGEILLEEAGQEIVSEEKAYGDVAGSDPEVTTGGEDIGNAVSMELDTVYAVGYRHGDTTFFKFTAPETGYYTFTAWGSNIGGEAGLFGFHYPETWYGQNPAANGYVLFMLEGSTYYLEGNTYNPDVPLEDKDTHEVVDPSGITSFMLKKNGGFSGFVEGCTSWEVGTQSSTRITFPPVPRPASSGYREYAPVKITVAQEGNYRFTMKFDESVVTGQTWPILLDEKGTVIAGPDGRPVVTGEVGADLAAGKAYYLISHELYEESEAVVDFTGALNDPPNSEYCSDGHGHVYDHRIEPASFTSAGSYADVCPICGHVGETAPIAQVEAWLEDTSFEYTGNAIEPEVTVSAGLSTLNSGYYTVEYFNNVEPGTASAVVTLTDDWYEGKETLTFRINSNGEQGYRADLTSVEINNLALPAAGQTLGKLQTEEIDVPGGQAYSHYYVDDFCWIKEEDWNGPYVKTEGLTSADAFEAGTTYVAKIILTAEDGYRFAADAQGDAQVSLSVNGNGEQLLTDPHIDPVDLYEDGTDDIRSIAATCKFVCEASGEDPGTGGSETGDVSNEEAIDRVGLNLTVPKPGTASSSSENLNFAAVPAKSKYTVEWTGWYGPGPEFADGVGSFTFEAGQTCRASITLKAEDGYDFADPLTVDVVGGTLVEVTEVYNKPGGGYSGVNLVVEVRIATVKSNQTITASDVRKTFGNAAFTLAASTSGDGTLSYASDNTKVAEVNGTTGLVTIKGAGTAVVTVTAAATANYNAASKKVTVTVAPAKLAAGNVAVASGTFTYNGKAQTPAVTVKSGTVTLKKDTDYTLKYSGNTNAGTAKATVTGKGNYTGTVTKTFAIGKAAQSITAKAAASSIAVGKTTTVSITGAKGKKTYKSSNTAIATVTSAGKVTAKKVGTVKITAASAAAANYRAASKTVTIKIVPAATKTLKAVNQAKGFKLSWAKVAGANGYIIYRNNKKVKTITSGATVTWTDDAANTNGTKYTYKVIAKASTGNSPLSKSVTYYRLAKPGISSVTNRATKKMAVKWGKNAKASGYQIQYCLKKNFSSGVKSVTVSGASAVSKTITGLTKGKIWYVRVRSYKTVSSKKYYSSWSALKSLKITR